MALAQKMDSMLRTFVCVNCETLIDVPQVEDCDGNPARKKLNLLIDMSNGKRQELSMLDAIYYVVKGISPDSTVDAEAAKESVYLCPSCEDVFGQLFNLHRDFLQLTSETSFIRQILKESESPLPTRRVKAVKVQMLKANPGESNGRKSVQVIIPPWNFQNDSSLRNPVHYGPQRNIPVTSGGLRKGTETRKVETEINEVEWIGSSTGTDGNDDFDEPVDIELIETFTESTDYSSHQPPNIMPRREKRAEIGNEFRIPAKRIRRKKTSNFSTAKVRAPPVLMTDEDKKLLITTLYKCDACEDHQQSFKVFRDWVVHHLETHGVDFGYGNIELLRTMPNLAPAYGRFRPCPTCGKKLRNNSLLLRHIKVKHLKQFSFSCHLCEKKLSSKVSLESHLAKIHPGPEAVRETFLCSLCGASCCTRGSLDQHEKTHLTLPGENKFACDICSVMCPSKSRLKTHKLTHSEERPFACQQCPGKFKAARHLDKHVRDVHATEKALVAFCEFCDKVYRRKNALKEHIMSRHKLSAEEARKSAKMREPRLFRVLEGGDRVFLEKKTKPKTCHICGVTYVRREGLFTHLVSVHNLTETEAKDVTGLESKRLGQLVARYRKSSKQTQ